MSQTITLDAPDSVFQPIQRVAQATSQPVEQLLLKALQASLPRLEGLPQEITENLTTLETLDDQALWEVMAETIVIALRMNNPTVVNARRLWVSVGWWPPSD